MNHELLSAAIDLTWREPPALVVAMALTFGHLARDGAKPLQDLLLSAKGGTWGERVDEGAGFPVLRSTNMRTTRVDVHDPAWCLVSAEESVRFELRTGDILVTKSSGSSDLVGKAALFADPGDGRTYLYSNFTLRLRPDPEQVVPEYVAWFLRSPQALSWRYGAQQTAVGLRNLKTKEYLRQSIPNIGKPRQLDVVGYLDDIASGAVSSARVPPGMSKVQKVVERIARVTDETRVLGEAIRASQAELDAVVPALVRAALE